MTEAATAKITGMTPVLAAANVERSIEFYRRVLGFGVLRRHPKVGAPTWAQLRAGDAALELVPRAAGDAASANGITLVLATDDVLGTWDALAAAGCKVGEHRLMSSGTMRCAFVDPDGNALAAEQPVEQVRMTKARLLELNRREHDRLDALVGPLAEPEMVEPGVQGVWSIKDILAHVAAWEARCIGQMEAGLQGKASPLFASRDVDQVNEQIWRENRDRPLADVRAGFDRSFERLTAAVEAVAEADLVAPDRLPWLEGSPLWLLVAYNAFDHYPRHAARVDAWLRGRR